MTQDGHRKKVQFIPAVAVNPGDAEAIESLQKEVSGGARWYQSLLRAIGLWASAEEQYNGRPYVYLIDGEAFDWLLLAERLTDTIDTMIPEKEREDLLFRGVSPLQLPASEVRELMGDKKYGMYLNYFYGITVEEALLLAVQVEVDKERHVQGIGYRVEIKDEAFRRIYDEDRDVLFEQFRKEKYLPHNASTSLDEMKQFTYWLFKYRLKRCEKARIASDTHKALTYLKRIWQLKGISPVLAVDLAPPTV
jgi:hypothetical protein